MPKTRRTSCDLYATVDGFSAGERVLLRELAAVDAACSRFRIDSEISGLHERAGSAVTVSPLLAETLTVALRAAQLTNGVVDPTVGNAIRALGCAGDFAAMTVDVPVPVPPPHPAPGWWRVRWNPASREVLLPRGVELDLGATAKALAADRIAVDAAEQAGCGVLVSLGGDVCAAGPAPDGGWHLGIGDDHERALNDPDLTVTIIGGGLATSGTTRRRWRRAGRDLHHIVDSPHRRRRRQPVAHRHCRRRVVRRRRHREHRGDRHGRPCPGVARAVPAPRAARRRRRPGRDHRRLVRPGREELRWPGVRGRRATHLPALGPSPGASSPGAWSSPRWMARSPTASVATATTRPAATAGTRRRCVLQSRRHGLGDLPEQVATELLDRLAPSVERQPNHYRHSDEAMLGLFETCARWGSAEISERAVGELARCIEMNVNKADQCFLRVGRSAKAIERLSALAENSNAVAIELLATWDVMTPAVRRSGVEAAQRIVRRPGGQPRNEWTIGEGAQEAALKFRRVAAESPIPAEISALRDQLVQHLMLWAEDGHDVAESRSEAVNAVRIIGGVLPPAARLDAFRRLVALHDDPRLNEIDERNQASLDPLSRFRFDTGSADFYADCLFAAAVLAVSHDEWDDVWNRIADALSSVALSRSAAIRVGRAAQCINEIKPVPLSMLVRHRIDQVRQCAVLCWYEDDHRDPVWVTTFAADEDAVVRTNLAFSLSALGGHDAILDQLRRDPSQNVRAAASRDPAD